MNASARTLKFGAGYQYIVSSDVWSFLDDNEKFMYNSRYLLQIGDERFLARDSVEFMFDLEFYYFYWEDRYPVKYESRIFTAYLPADILYSINFIKNDKYMLYLKAGPAFRILLLSYKKSIVGDNSRTEWGTIFSAPENIELSTLDKFQFAFIIKPGIDIYR